jgi:hypothetical protein
MSRRIYRFLGDPVGYGVEGDTSGPWVRAQVGIRDQYVWINPSMAYVVESDDAPLSMPVVVTGRVEDVVLVGLAESAANPSESARNTPAKG